MWICSFNDTHEQRLMLRIHLPYTPIRGLSQRDHFSVLLPSPISYSTFTARYMPRRPRPAPRGKPGKEKKTDNVASSSRVQLPLPKAISKRKLKILDSEPESEELNDDEESSSDSEEDDEEGDDDTSLGGDSEESDVDVDAPRVAQWVDEDDLDQPQMASGDASHGNAEDAGDIVRVVYVSLGFR